MVHIHHCYYGIWPKFVVHVLLKDIDSESASQISGSWAPEP